MLLEERIVLGESAPAPPFYVDPPDLATQV